MENPKTLQDKYFGEIPLNRFFERNAFPPILMVILVVVGIMILFNLIGGITMVMVLFDEVMRLFNQNPVTATDELNKLMTQRPNEMITGNTVGMWFGLGLPMLWLAARHSSEIKAFLRLKPVSIPILLLSAVGWFLLFPIVGFLSQINEMLPVPHWMDSMEEARKALMSPSFFQNINPILLFFGIAITPAICEELMFRGYIQRQLDRSFAPIVAVIICGILFGAYHLSLKQLLPLSCIGIYLCWLTYRTGSIYPAMLVHLLNNGLAAILGLTFAKQKGVDLEKLGNVDLPLLQMLPLVLICTFLFWKWDAKLKAES